LGSFGEIKDFKENFNQILTDKTEEEKSRITSQIDLLRNKAELLSRSVEKEREKRKLELNGEREKIASQTTEFLVGSKEARKSQKRLKKIEHKFDKIVEKPLKKEKKQSKKYERGASKLENKSEKIITKNVAYLHKTNKIIEQNMSYYQGARGEETAIETMSRLPDTYYVFNDLNLKLPKAVRYKKSREYVRSCQIDHLVVGPSGIFLIEAKNWSEKTFREATFLPHKQVDRAGLVFYIFMVRKLKTKYTTYKVVATMRKLPYIHFQYVDQLTVYGLNSFILKKPKKLSEEDIQKIVKWLMRYYK